MGLDRRDDRHPVRGDGNGRGLLVLSSWTVDVDSDSMLDMLIHAHQWRSLLCISCPRTRGLGTTSRMAHRVVQLDVSNHRRTVSQLRNGSHDLSLCVHHEPGLHTYKLPDVPGLLDADADSLLHVIYAYSVASQD